VETHLFAALKATRLVAPDSTWGSVEYSRCGRTDAGVSALRQVLRTLPLVPVRAAHLTSCICAQVVVLRCRSSGTTPELDYVGALNRQLPDSIRVLSWRPAPAAFSARFKCVCRPI
jgi:tRNA pseudouridine38/39 synthase